MVHGNISIAVFFVNEFFVFLPMRWFKFGSVIIIFLLSVYAVSMIFVAENKSFTIEKEISYPVDKVFPQFNNLQNFSRWSGFFSDNKNLTFDFFTPYEGQGSSMSYHDTKDPEVFGDLFIRYENPNRTLRYQLFEGRRSNPYLIDLKFVAQNGKTKITWYVQTPKQPFLKRSLNLITEEDITADIETGMKTLFTILGNKVNKEQQRESIKFDTLMVEEKEGQLLLGVNVNSKNTKDALFKNIVMNHNKTINFIKMDLGKREDEYGEPVLITNAGNFKDKEVSYYYGIPLSKRIGVSDNNFIFRTVNASRNYVIYYQGSYAGRVGAIQELLLKAKRDTMRTGDLQQTFLEEPTVESNTVMKLSLPVFR